MRSCNFTKVGLRSTWACCKKVSTAIFTVQGGPSSAAGRRRYARLGSITQKSGRVANKVGGRSRESSCAFATLINAVFVLVIMRYEIVVVRCYPQPRSTSEAGVKLLRPQEYRIDSIVVYGRRRPGYVECERMSTMQRSKGHKPMQGSEGD